MGYIFYFIFWGAWSGEGEKKTNLRVKKNGAWGARTGASLIGGAASSAQRRGDVELGSCCRSRHGYTFLLLRSGKGVLDAATDVRTRD